MRAGYDCWLDHDPRWISVPMEGERFLVTATEVTQGQAAGSGAPGVTWRLPTLAEWRALDRHTAPRAIPEAGLCSYTNIDDLGTCRRWGEAVSEEGQSPFAPCDDGFSYLMPAWQTHERADPVVASVLGNVGEFVTDPEEGLLACGDSFEAHGGDPDCNGFLPDEMPASVGFCLVWEGAPEVCRGGHAPDR